MKIEHIGWIAGFLEGEGSFGYAKSTPAVSAVQVDREPIDLLYRLLGGGINTFSRKEVKGNIYYRWNAYGPRAAGIMMTVYPLMTKRRQKRIREELARWMSKGRSETDRKTNFGCGHNKEEHGVRINPTKKTSYLRCRTCHNEIQRKYRGKLSAV